MAEEGPVILTIDYADEFQRRACEALRREIESVGYDPSGLRFCMRHAACTRTVPAAFGEATDYMDNNPDALTEGLVICRTPLGFVPPHMQANRINDLRDKGYMVVEFDPEAREFSPPLQKEELCRVLDIVLNARDTRLPSLRVLGAHLTKEATAQYLG